ncbi:hypothetical protein Ami103574_02445 [Aminipila butyrica]|uniref:Uncharacterized protein n=1 Tax=Aminipila butyrica TaxID=433296 RepID=A0A858BSQ0_9FIRM|nr:hypothetical protein [Aminipila butyrica]QIB68239.1 hypothetical protein Ami103574_02445 [Aminipila butyrica]
MKSIMQSEKCCYITGNTIGLEEHHIFGGSNRKYSEKYGLKVWLRHDWHNEPPYGVHHNKDFMQQLHEVGQKAFEERWGSREEFRSIFGKSYL